MRSSIDAKPMTEWIGAPAAIRLTMAPLNAAPKSVSPVTTV